MGREYVVRDLGGGFVVFLVHGLGLLSDKYMARKITGKTQPKLFLRKKGGDPELPPYTKDLGILFAVVE